MLGACGPPALWPVVNRLCTCRTISWARLPEGLSSILSPQSPRSTLDRQRDKPCYNSHSSCGVAIRRHLDETYIAPYGLIVDPATSLLYPPPAACSKLRSATTRHHRCQVFLLDFSRRRRLRAGVQSNAHPKAKLSCHQFCQAAVLATLARLNNIWRVAIRCISSYREHI